MLALDVGGNAPPIGFRGHIERRVDAGISGKVGRDRRAAGAPDRGANGRADGTAAPVTKTILFLRPASR